MYAILKAIPHSSMNTGSFISVKLLDNRKKIIYNFKYQVINPRILQSAGILRKDNLLYYEGFIRQTSNTFDSEQI